MNLYIESKKQDILLDSLIYALRGYFGEIFINEEKNLQDNRENDVNISVNEPVIILNYGENSHEFSIPFKVGDILQKIMIARQNNRAREIAAPITIGNYILHPASNIIEMGSKKIALTDKEFDIIVKIFKATPKRVTRTALLQEIWGYNNQIETHTLETHIYRLRQKIEQDPTDPQFLKTDDEGYYLNF